MPVLQPTPVPAGRRPADEELRLIPDLAPGAKPGSATWWDRVTAEGTPLSFPHGLRQADGTRTGIPTLVFLARESQAPHVYLDLNGLTDRSDLARGTMTAVHGTDVHLAAFAVHPDYLGSYKVIPVSGALESPAPRNTPQARAWWLGVLATSRLDPYARGRQYTGSLGAACTVAQLGEPTALPSGPNDLTALTWQRPDGVEQRVWLWLPEDDGTALGLALLFDGQMWADQLPAAPILADLHRRRAIPPTAAVLIDVMSQDQRSADLASADDYLDHLTESLLPLIDAELIARGRVRSTDPTRTIAAGQSYGGLAAFRLAARHPEVVGGSLSQSGSFWWPSQADDGPRAMHTWLAAQPIRTTRTVLQVGLYEDLLTRTNRELAELITERGEPLDFREVPGGHDWAWWSQYLADGLVAVLHR